MLRGSITCESSLQATVRNFRIDLRGRDLPMPQRPLHKVQVPSPAVQLRGKRMPERMHRRRNSRLPAQLGEVELDLPRAQPLPVDRAE